MELLVAGMAYLDVFVPRAAAPAGGEEVFVDALTLSFGGAANNASVAAALGLEVGLCAPAGQGMADLALGALAARLGFTLLPWPAPDNPAVSLVLTDAGERAFVSAARFEVLDRVTTLPAAKWILVPGLEEAQRLAAPLARARAAGTRVAVSASWRPERLAELAHLRGQPWDLLVLNQKEAATACADLYDAPHLLGGAAHSVVVTLGAAGAFGVLEGEAVTAEAGVVPIIDSTGAGDAFCTAVLAALIRGQRPAQALAFGNCAAAHMIQQQGGLLHEAARIAKLIEEIPWKR
ncbi:carbohydrate kinase family protein [Massilia sp. PAMC28688]|uniref:carbohydrate kinase family protein n=1 Tax=Massilia sp. PAMC28688 TaxID=2861283 RepID=UPI001C63A82D|nr:PfkB family carbohydrate kinase [Massilia sp. PAMC28688]QYF96124.1 carbohydrate kinase family protein [Massilia sp. PAMC28688]